MKLKLISGEYHKNALSNNYNFKLCPRGSLEGVMGGLEIPGLYLLTIVKDADQIFEVSESLSDTEKEYTMKRLKEISVIYYAYFSIGIN